MNLRFVLYLLSLWFLVRFLSSYLRPLFRQGMQVPEESSRAADGRSHAQSNRGGTVTSQGRSAQGGQAGDYIEFEEVK